MWNLRKPFPLNVNLHDKFGREQARKRPGCSSLDNLAQDLRLQVVIYKLQLTIQHFLMNDEKRIFKSLLCIISNFLNNVQV